MKKNTNIPNPALKVSAGFVKPATTGGGDRTNPFGKFCIKRHLATDQSKLFIKNKQSDEYINETKKFDPNMGKVFGTVGRKNNPALQYVFYKNSASMQNLDKKQKDQDDGPSIDLRAKPKNEIFFIPSIFKKNIKNNLKLRPFNDILSDVGDIQYFPA